MRHPPTASDGDCDALFGLDALGPGPVTPSTGSVSR